MSASHRTTNFAVLERLSAVEHDPSDHLDDAAVRGAVVLATCNRFETYLDVEADTETEVEAAVQSALERISASTGLDGAQIRAGAATMTSSRVAAHLFAVASGLDSVVVGEDEIAGQVRKSFAEAHRAGTTTADLTRLFQAASTTSRGVKNSTGINTAGRSMVRLALDLAESRIPSWEQASVLIIGTGAYARTTLVAMRERGVHTAGVASPSGREQIFASREGVRPVPATELPAALARADLILTSTNVLALDAGTLRAARAELSRTTARPATWNRPGLLAAPGTASQRAAPGATSQRAAPGDTLHRETPTQLIIDLGLPSNVAKDVLDLPGVDLLDLETISLHAPVQDLNASAQARDLVDAAAREFAHRSAQQAAAPAIVAYRRHIEELAEAEVQRARQRGEHSEDVERALRHFAAVLAHTPTARARELAAQDRLDEVTDALAILHGLDVTAAPVHPIAKPGDETSRTG